MRPEWTPSGKEAVLRAKWAQDEKDAFCSKPLFMSELRDALAVPFRLPEAQEEKERAYDFRGNMI